MKKIITKILVAFLTLVISVSAFVGCKPTQTSTPTEIKNIVIIIGDGMGFEHVEAGQLYENKEYAFTKWLQTSVNTDSVDVNGNEVLTDSAAGGTAIATGCLTVNGYVGMDSKGNSLETVLDFAKGLGKATGIVTTDTIYGATPASFSAHSLSRNNANEIILSQINNSGVDLLCGSIDPTSASYKNEIINQGYVYCDNIDDVQSTMQYEKAYWQIGVGSRSAPVKLATATEQALNFLQKDEEGFVLVIEQAHIDKYSHNNDFDGVVKSVQSLNDTVEVVMDWIGDKKDTAVFITADHETGGLFVSAYDEHPMIYNNPNGMDIYYEFGHGNHTQTCVGLYVYGVAPDFSAFKRYKDNNKIKNIETNEIITMLLFNPTVYS